MNKKQLIVTWIIIVLLLIIIFQLWHIASVVDSIDWDVRNILGKMR